MATLNGILFEPINGVVSGTDDFDDVIIAGASDTGITLDGRAGSDTLQSSGTNNTLLGGEGGDSLESTEFAINTTMDGGAGSDFIIGGGSNDTASYASAAGGMVVNLGTFSASDGDFLSGIENVTGSAFNDSLTGDVNANVLQGGAGNDTLTGGGGADVFKYSFDVTQGGTTSTFTEFFAEHGGTVVGGEVADGTKQGQFSSLYTQWLESLGLNVLDLGQNAGISGTPVIGNMTGEFGDRENFTWTSGSGKKTVTHERWYSDTWSSGGEETVTTTEDGFDTILGFASEDVLDFSDITQEQFDDHFTVVDNGTDTVITMDSSSGWQLTLSGVTDQFTTNDIIFA